MSMSRTGVVRVVSEARERGERPDLRCADLRFTDLRGANLWRANLRDADLRFTDLRFTDLRFTDLRGADLRGAYLRHADLRGANLRDTDLCGTVWCGLQITDLPSGKLTLIPTSDGWRMRVGCWDGTPDQLRDLIAQDDDWPEAEGEEITRRRPYLAAALALCEAHMKDHAGEIDKLKERWGDQ